MVVLSMFFFKQKTAYEMRISDWSSDVCSSDLDEHCRQAALPIQNRRASSDRRRHLAPRPRDELTAAIGAAPRHRLRAGRAEGALETADQGFPIHREPPLAPLAERLHLQRHGSFPRRPFLRALENIT